MSKARGLADLGNVYNDGALSNRNLIINGSFDVWQRGITGSGNGYKSADRWNLNTYTAGTISLTQKTDAVGQSFTNYARFEQSVVDTNDGKQALMQTIEGSHAVGKEVTVSFKARANAALSGCLVRGVFATQTFNLTTEWQRFTFTGIALANGANVRPIFDFGAANTLWYVDIAEVQLEVGPATPFEHRSYGQELALCQRYYTKLGAGGPYMRFGSGLNVSTVTNSSFVNLPTTMRAVGTLTTSGSSTFAIYAAAGSVYTCSNVVIDTSGTSLNAFTANATTSSLVAGGFGTLLAQNNAAAYLAIDSEL